MHRIWLKRPAAKRASRTNAQWSEATIDALLQRARSEFAELGYAEASVERIADGVGLSKGAVYYHFGSKEGLFEAVFRVVEQDLVFRIEAKADAAGEPLQALIAGCEAFLEVALDDELRQIALLDAPAVLGWQKWRAIDGEFGLGSLKEGLRACQAAGLLRGANPDALAHLISGAVNEAAFLIAESKDRARARNAFHQHTASPGERSREPGLSGASAAIVTNSWPSADRW